MHIVNTMDYSIFFFLNGAPKARGRMDWEQQTVGKHFDDDGGGLPSKQGQGSEWGGTVRGYQRLICQVKRNWQPINKELRNPLPMGGYLPLKMWSFCIDTSVSINTHTFKMPPHQLQMHQPLSALKMLIFVIYSPRKNQGGRDGISSKQKHHSFPFFLPKVWQFLTNKHFSLCCTSQSVFRALKWLF